jgi:hypothetical protein
MDVPCPPTPPAGQMPLPRLRPTAWRPLSRNRSAWRVVGCRGSLRHRARLQTLRAPRRPALQSMREACRQWAFNRVSRLQCPCFISCHAWPVLSARPKKRYPLFGAPPASEHLAQNHIQRTGNQHGRRERQNPGQCHVLDRAPLQSRAVRRHRARNAAARQHMRRGYRQPVHVRHADRRHRHDLGAGALP